MNIDNELLISRYGNGLKLKNATNDDNQQTVAGILKYPFNIFFTNNECQLAKVNSICAETCGFDSEAVAIGKTAFDFSIKESANFAIRTDHEVMLENKIKIFDQDLVRNDGKIYHYLTIKSPWYDSHNKITGIFGCSIAVGKHSLSESLHLIAELGLLNPNVSNLLLVENKEVYLSRQQLSCAKLLIAGLKVKEIAHKLNLSHRTVETYLENIKLKLRCSNKTELILKLSEKIKSTEN